MSDLRVHGRFAELPDEELDALARSLASFAPSSDRAERTREELVERARAVTPLRRRRTHPATVTVAVAIPLAAAASVFFAVRSRPATPVPEQGDVSPHVASQPEAGAEPQPGPRRIARIEASPDAHFERLSVAPDEVVSVEHGVYVFEVAKLEPGERFRVVTEDATVEVRGTKFEVEANDRRLASVWVIDGRVQVRPTGGAPVILAAGEGWEAVTENQVPVATRTSAPHQRVSGRPAKGKEEDAPAAPLEARLETNVQENEPGIALSPRPGPGEDAFLQGWSLLRAGDAKGAAPYFAAACDAAAAEPLGEDACFWAGVAWKRVGQQAQARSALRTFVRRFPKSARSGEASALLGWLCYEAGDPAAAEKYFRAAVGDPVPEVDQSARAGLRVLRRTVGE